MGSINRNRKQERLLPLRLVGQRTTEQTCQLDPWGRPYLYLSPGDNGEVDIYTLGADGLAGGEDQNADIGNWKESEG